jgi:hypothetical protein
MSTKITSTNQSGGITGQNVTVTGSVSSQSTVISQPEPKRSWRKVAAWVVGAIGLLASVLGILDYFDMKFWR